MQLSQSLTLQNKPSNLFNSMLVDFNKAEQLLKMSNKRDHNDLFNHGVTGSKQVRKVHLVVYSNFLHWVIQ